MSGANAAGGLPGYKKVMTTDFYPELFNTAPAAPPDAGVPWTGPGYAESPLIDDPATPPPPAPDRGIKHLGSCSGCGATNFSPTDAAPCANCGEMQQAVTPTYTPGTPWF